MASVTGDTRLVDPGLVRQLADETTTLVRQELELARAEAARAGEAGDLAKQELQLATAEDDRYASAWPRDRNDGSRSGVGLPQQALSRRA